MSTLITLVCNNVNAASQGKHGTQSSASIEISVTVHQSLSAVSPTELILSDYSKTKSISSHPFCVAHNGLNNDTGLSYDLVVDSLKQNSDADLYDIYFKTRHDSKKLLTRGATITRQSLLENNSQLSHECTQLSIEKKANMESTKQTSGSAGLLILLVRPQ